MNASGLLHKWHVPKQVPSRTPECPVRAGAAREKLTRTIALRHWLWIYILVAVIALAVGYYVFGGANMGR
jgi:hypothetical protein